MREGCRCRSFRFRAPERLRLHRALPNLTLPRDVQLEQLQHDPSFQATVQVEERELLGQPPAEDVVPLELGSGMIVNVPVDRVAAVHETLAQQPLAAQVGGTLSSSSSSVLLPSTLGAALGSAASGSASSGMRAGSSHGGGPAAASGGRGSATAATRLCSVCGMAPPPGRKLRKCGGCRQVRSRRHVFPLPGRPAGGEPQC